MNLLSFIFVEGYRFVLLVQSGIVLNSMFQIPLRRNSPPHTTNTPSIFNESPVFIISVTFSLSEENTIAFGGVAIGSMNAYELK